MSTCSRWNIPLPCCPVGFDDLLNFQFSSFSRRTQDVFPGWGSIPLPYMPYLLCPSKCSKYMEISALTSLCKILNHSLPSMVKLYNSSTLTVNNQIYTKQIAFRQTAKQVITKLNRQNIFSLYMDIIPNAFIYNVGISQISR